MKNPWGLPPRQAEAIELLAAEGCNKRIARRMQIDARTVEEHLRRAFRRMAVSNRVHAALMWDRWVRSK